MNAAHLLHHVPAIEKKILDHQLDALVVGMGPSAWLVPWLDRRMTDRMRLWGAHDVHRIMPVDDLCLIDSPSKTKRIMPGTKALEAILASRPSRIWINDWYSREWRNYIHPPLLPVTVDVRFWVWTHPNKHKVKNKPEKWQLGWEIPHCGLISPTACTTMAWQHGARRIGIIGMDCGPEHGTHQLVDPLNRIFCMLAQDAHEKGGCVINLSPVTYLDKFASWTPSESSSAPSPASETTTPNGSSSTASASTLPAPSTSPSCEPAIPGGKPPATGKTGPGESAQP